MKLDYENNIISMTDNGKIVELDMDKEWICTLNRLHNDSETNITKEVCIPNPVNFVKCALETIIPAQKDVNVKVNLTQKLLKVSHFTPNESLLHNKKLHVLWNEDDFETNMSEIRILNLGRQDIRLLHETIIGEIEGEVCNYDESVSLVDSVLFDGGGCEIDINKDLTPEQNSKAKRLINKYKHLFSTNEIDFEEAKLPEYKFKLTDYTPIAKSPYRLPIAQRTEIDRQVELLIKAGIVCETQSHYASPAFLVTKKDGGFRLVVDYKMLNEKILPDRYPLPLLQTIFDSLDNSDYFSTLDIRQAFFQQPLHEDCRKYVAFATHKGLYTFKRLPFGLRTSPNAFQRAINQVFNDYLYRGVLIYLDDIISYGESFDKQYQQLEKTLKRLQDVGLKLNTSKCHFFYRKIKVLGHTVSKEGIQPASETLEAIEKYPIPKTVKDVRAFLGLSGFYRKFIQNYAIIARPLTNLISKNNENKPITWEEDQQNAFSEIKSKLLSQPVLHHFNNDKEVVVHTDASRVGIGGIISQPDDNGKLHPVAFVSRKLTKHEENWAVGEIELLSIVYCVNYFRQYLIGRLFTIYTDHASLQYYKTWKNPSIRVSKLLMKLTEFTFDLKYKPGAQMHVPDALSRYPLEKDITDLTKDENYNIFEIEEIDIKTLQKNDESIRKIYDAIRNPNHSDTATIRKARKYTIEKDIVYLKKFDGHTNQLKLLVPRSLINKILETFHDDSLTGGHTGIYKTHEKISSKYYWENMYENIANYVRSCKNCQERKTPTTKPQGFLSPIKCDSKPFSSIMMDYIGPLESSMGYSYILTIVDLTTRYILAEPCKHADANNTTKCLWKLIYRFGVPKEVRSDRGTHFVNKKVDDLMVELGIKHILGSSSHHQSQGLAERANRTIQEMLTAYVADNRKLWVQMLPKVLFAYNTSKQCSLKYTPFFLLHGFEATTPLDLKIFPENDDVTYHLDARLANLKEVREQIPSILSDAQEKQKYYYDRNRTDCIFEPGDLVMVHDPDVRQGQSRKLVKKYSGPYEVVKKVTDEVYEIFFPLRGTYKNVAFHVDKLKKYFIRDPIN